MIQIAKSPSLEKQQEKLIPPTYFDTNLLVTLVLKTARNRNLHLDPHFHRNFVLKIHRSICLSKEFFEFCMERDFFFEKLLRQHPQEFRKNLSLQKKFLAAPEFVHYSMDNPLQYINLSLFKKEGLREVIQAFPSIILRCPSHLLTPDLLELALNFSGDMALDAKLSSKKEGFCFLVLKKMCLGVYTRNEAINFLEKIHKELTENNENDFFLQKNFILLILFAMLKYEFFNRDFLELTKVQESLFID